MKVKRNIVRIDEEKCNGCGLCIDACAEGAIQLVDGKARLIKDSYCDGLGACLGDCPQDAISIDVREADPFDETAVAEHLKDGGVVEPESRPRPTGGGCPGLAALSFGTSSEAGDTRAEPTTGTSALRQWPVQLHLVNPHAPYWQGADLLVAADCVAAAFGGFHAKLLHGRRLVLACPKLDDTSGYLVKLTAILADNDIKSVTVAHMEVPCCTGIVRLVEQAVADCGKEIACDRIEISVRGERIPDA